MVVFCAGAIACAALIASVFFFKFWRRTRDRLFALFGVSFALISVERIVLVALGMRVGEAHPLVYLIRLLAFVLIVVAIIDKNRRESR